jgi:hypothetical protein
MLLLVLFGVLALLVLVASLPDIKRYIEISSM